MIPELLKKRADGLLRWDGTKQMGGSDVLAWVMPDKTYRVAIQGRADRLEARLFGKLKYPLNNYERRLEIQLQHLLGFEDASLEKGGWGTSVRGGVGQIFSSDRRDVSVDEIFEGIESTLRSSLEESRVDFTVMPLEGKPWFNDLSHIDKTMPYYSAKKRKVLHGTAPSGLMEVDVEAQWSRGEMERRVAPGVDFCTVAPKLTVDEGGIVGVVKGQQILLTRCINIGMYSAPLEQVIAGIQRCGNAMLYPSLALSDVPATNFGLLTLFARIPLASRSLRPEKVKGWPALVYKTDAWTETTRDFERSASVELFEQLTGNWSPRAYGHMNVLGPRLAEGTTSLGHEAHLAKSVSDVAGRMKRIRARWKPKMTRSQIEAATDLTDLRYPYLEVKVGASVAVADTFPLATCPSYLIREVKQMLGAVGFNGKILPIDVSMAAKRALESGDAAAQWEYAWLVREQALAFADSNRLFWHI